MAIDKLRDCGSERSLLGIVLQNGKDAIIDCESIISSTDFSLPLNKAIYLSLTHLADDPNCESFDTESIRTKAKALGFESYFNNPKNVEYLELLNSSSSDIKNIPLFALQVKKYAIARDLYKRYDESKKYLDTISGNETISEIIQNAEGGIVDYITGSNDTSKLSEIGENIDEYIENLIIAEPVTQVGISTNNPIYDNAIGSIRPGTVHVIAARPKCGKSYDAINKTRNVARQGLPVLYLDTELTLSYQKNRLLAIDSGCPIKLLETGQFNRYQELIDTVRVSGQRIIKYPITYQNISGLGHVEAISIIKRWLIKKVGFNEKGEANPCLVVYDYLKLTNADALSAHSPEYLLLGFAIQSLHNTAVKYNIPILTYAQLNREGIEGVETNIIAGSDRILWLCSSLSIIRNKDETDVELGCDFNYGNKKLIILETRQGSGLENERDYINLKASLRPRIGEFEATGHIVEGLLFSEISMNNRNNNNGDSNKPNQSQNARNSPRSRE